MSTQSATYLPDGIAKPAPSPDGLDAEFWEGAKNGEIRVQRCTNCGTHRMPEWICHNCRSFDFEWVVSNGRGTIFSWERVWHPVMPELEGTVPYVVVLVELDDCGHVRLVGNLLGEPRDDVVIGSPVAAEFEHHDGYSLIQWKRA